MTASTKENLQLLKNFLKKIDEARETLDKEKRKELYAQALDMVMELAVELPLYQRGDLYAYNSNVINSESLPGEINPYTSPLDRIWEIEFAN